MTHKEWIKTILKSYQKRHKPEAAEVEHVLDFLEKNPKFKVSTRVSYLSVKQKSETWTKSLNKKNKNLKESGAVEKILEFEDGASFVRLLDQTAKNWEGKHMGHCVASYTSHEGIYSLRDDENIPHCTVEVVAGKINQIKGKANSKVAFRYHSQVLEGINHKGINLTKRDVENIGYLSVSSETERKLKENFTDITWLELDRVKYFNTHSKLKLIKPLTRYSVEIFDLLTNHQVDCLTAFKQSLTLHPNLATAPFKLLTNKFCVDGRGLYLRALVDFFKKQKMEFIVTSELITCAIKSGDFEIVNFLLEVSKKQETQELERNPFNSFLARDKVCDFNICIEPAVVAGRLDMLMALLKAGAKIDVRFIPELLNLAIRDNNLEAFNVCLAARRKINLSMYTQHVMSLYSQKKLALLDVMSKAFLESDDKYAQDLYYMWLKNYDGKDLSFLDYIISHHGFKESDYLATFRNVVVSSHQGLVEEFVKRGANLEFNKGEALSLALTNHKLVLASSLIQKGFLDIVSILPITAEPALKLLVRDLLHENNQDFLFKLLKRMEELNMKGVVNLLHVGGIITPEQRQAAIDSAAGLEIAASPKAEEKRVFLDTARWNKELDEFAEKNGIMSQAWKEMTLTQKIKQKTKYENDQAEAAASLLRNPRVDVDGREYEEPLRRYDPMGNVIREMARRGVTRNEYGHCVDEDGRRYRDMEELIRNREERRGRRMYRDGRVFEDD